MDKIDQEKARIKRGKHGGYIHHAKFDFYLDCAGYHALAKLYRYQGRSAMEDIFIG